ncbi:MAG: Polyketide biosynthesis acyl-carrier-protein AcpK [Verrucomicrobia subdivision 3 bacterium]|nr:Polyketide biosynthesis acyl-carrier-protein AcpK [Limisphaerales bacterium]MCS1417874.1 Polyketide biosynthesis acyl-carrier-protein AcpK [Limisphaerales bacterium]UWK15743.1 LasC [uncultured Verrucomicrobiota bacterium]UWK15764.1 LasC [uncultured Verrucomicrobiota bacterium]
MRDRREEIFGVIKQNVLEVLVDLDPKEVTLDKSLVELGANSVDRVEVAMYSMEALGLKLSRVELHGVEDLQGLVDVFYEHLAED